MSMTTKPFQKLQGFYETSCPECQSTNVIEDHSHGDLVCQSCGFVVGEKIIDTEREWREFESDDNSAQKSRVGGPSDPLLSGSELSTTIGKTDEKFKGLSRAMRANKQENKTLIEGFRRVDAMAEKIELPEKYRNTAKELFKQLEEKKALRGRSHDSIVAACLYMACRMENVARTLKEIVALSNVSKKDIGKAYKHILSVLNKKVDIIAAGDFMVRFCNHLSLSPFVSGAAEHVSKRTQELGIAAGKVPITIAAASIYLVTQLTEKEKKSHKEIADITGVSEPTIRNCLKDMEPRKQDLLPPTFLARVQSQKL